MVYNCISKMDMKRFKISFDSGVIHTNLKQLFQRKITLKGIHSLNSFVNHLFHSSFKINYFCEIGLIYSEQMSMPDFYWKEGIKWDSQLNMFLLAHKPTRDH